MMKEYEVVHEIFNLCSGNQMRDVFIEEIEIPEGAFEEYIRCRHKEKDIKLEREDLPNGNVIYNVYGSNYSPVQRLFDNTGNIRTDPPFRSAFGTYYRLWFYVSF